MNPRIFYPWFLRDPGTLLSIAAWKGTGEKGHSTYLAHWYENRPVHAATIGDPDILCEKWVPRQSSLFFFWRILAYSLFAPVILSTCDASEYRNALTNHESKCIVLVSNNLAFPNFIFVISHWSKASRTNQTSLLRSPEVFRCYLSQQNS